METPEPTDSQLIIALQGGSAAALDELLARYQRPVVNFCYRLLNDAGDADDCAQETFVRVYQHCRKFRSGENFSTWLFAIARNLCRDRQRWRRRHPTEPLESAPEPAQVSREVENREIAARIAAATAELPEEQRVAVILAEYHGQSHAEIAGVLRCSAKAVETKLYRARQFLRTRLADFIHEA
jgi:RNA polymerase sigma-70 factor (ECF subfamily)